MSLKQTPQYSYESDALIVGAGLVGSSVAMHLANHNLQSIQVVDLDLAGVFSSSELNAGGVRATWNHPLNAALSRVSIDYYEGVKREIGFLQKGYTWMYSLKEWKLARERLQKNKNLSGLGIEYLSPQELSARYSFLNKTSDLGGASFSPKDGLINPNLLKLHYRDQAKSRGVVFRDRIWISECVLRNDKTFELKGWKWPQELSESDIRKVLLEEKENLLNGMLPPGAEVISFKTKYLINCSGAWAKRFAEFMGTTSVSRPYRRQVSVFDCRDVNISDFGMFVDSSGVYFHAEASNILSGFAIPNERAGFDLEYDGESFFQEYIWPALYERSTAFENLKHLTGWAGLYEVSPDHSAIIGKIPGFENAFEAHSFSGRGAMQSYGAGHALAELIMKGRYESLDLSGLGADRFAEGKEVSEGLLI